MASFLEYISPNQQHPVLSNLYTIFFTGIEPDTGTLLGKFGLIRGKTFYISTDKYS
jgi:hypothetical protein